MWIGTGIVYNQSLQPAPTRWADLWDSRLKGRVTMLDDPEDMIGSLPEENRIALRCHRPRAIASAPKRQPWNRRSSFVPISMPRSATNWSLAMCWQRSSGPPPPSKPWTPLPTWLLPIPRKDSRSTATARDSAREPAGRAGAQVPRLCSAAQCLRRSCGIHAHRHCQRRGPRYSAGRDAKQSHVLSSSCGF